MRLCRVSRGGSFSSQSPSQQTGVRAVPGSGRWSEVWWSPGGWQRMGFTGGFPPRSFRSHSGGAVQGGWGAGAAG